MPLFLYAFSKVLEVSSVLIFYIFYGFFSKMIDKLLMASKYFAEGVSNTVYNNIVHKNKERVYELYSKLNESKFELQDDRRVRCIDYYEDEVKQREQSDK